MPDGPGYQVPPWQPPPVSPAPPVLQVRSVVPFWFFVISNLWYAPLVLAVDSATTF